MSLFYDIKIAVYKYNSRTVQKKKNTAHFQTELPSPIQTQKQEGSTKIQSGFLRNKTNKKKDTENTQVQLPYGNQ